MKTLYIIAGCNGAGKTTASITMLPEIWKCREFVNAVLVESQSNPRIIIAENSGNGIEIHNETLYNKVKAYVS